MKILYNNKTIDVIICNSFFKRLKGIMFLKKKLNYALLFPKCNSIHTFFCFQKIDVIIIDKNNKIIYFKKNIGKNKIIINKNGYSTLETPNNYFNDLEIGKYLEIINKKQNP